MLAIDDAAMIPSTPSSNLSLRLFSSPCSIPRLASSKAWDGAPIVSQRNWSLLLIIFTEGPSFFPYFSMTPLHTVISELMSAIVISFCWNAADTSLKAAVTICEEVEEVHDILGM